MDFTNTQDSIQKIEKQKQVLKNNLQEYSIVVISKNRCPMCMVLKEELSETKIKHIIIDLEENESVERNVFRLNKHARMVMLPIVFLVKNEDVVKFFDMDNMTEDFYNTNLIGGKSEATKVISSIES